MKSFLSSDRVDKTRFAIPAKVPISGRAPRFVALEDLTMNKLPEFSDRRTLIEKAVELADKVFHASGLADQRVIDPLALAASFRSTVTFDFINANSVSPTDPAWVSAAILREPFAVPQILIERDDSPYRRRFSLVHEIAHLLFEPSSATVVDKRRPYHRPQDDLAYFSERPKEYFADMFAHMFLMPDALFNQFVRIGQTDEEISLRLKVSRLSVHNRRVYHDILSGRFSD